LVGSLGIIIIIIIYFKIKIILAC